MGNQSPSDNPTPTGTILSKIWGVLTRRDAREKARAKKLITASLRDEATAMLQHRGVDASAYIPYGTSDYELRNIIAHLPNHDIDDINEAITEAFIAYCPGDQLLTDDHITVSKRLSHAFVNAGDYDEDLFKPGQGTSALDEYRQVMLYAMQHIEDGQFIVSMLYDRKIGTLAEMLELLPALKSSAHPALTEGAL